jgi:hypothetical protein
MGLFQRFFGSWHVDFGRLAKDELGNDYVVEETRIVPKVSAEDRYGVVCWHDRPKKFQGTVVHYLPLKLTVLHPQVDPATVVRTPRGFRVSRAAEECVGGFVRILGFDSTDPTGEYQMDLLANGNLIAAISFTVIEGIASNEPWA